MRRRKDILWKYAPVWVILFSTGAALTKLVGQRYLLHRQWHLKASDVGTALLGAVVGYATFRYRHGNKSGGFVTR